MSYSGNVRRRVFISYYHGDQVYVNEFVRDFGHIFIPKTVGVKDGDFDFKSQNPEYIMRRIREEKIQDATVTVVLIGSCTHSRRYVDWEIRASLQQGQTLPNGLIGINLPYMGSKSAAPQRLIDNLAHNLSNQQIGYARYYTYPSSESTLRTMIEDAFDARTSRAYLIHNDREMKGYNRKCDVHGVVH